MCNVSEPKVHQGDFSESPQLKGFPVLGSNHLHRSSLHLFHKEDYVSWPVDGAPVYGPDSGTIAVEIVLTCMSLLFGTNLFRTLAITLSLWTTSEKMQVKESDLFAMLRGPWPPQKKLMQSDYVCEQLLPKVETQEAKGNLTSLLYPAHTRTHTHMHTHTHAHPWTCTHMHVCTHIHVLATVAVTKHTTRGTMACP